MANVQEGISEEIVKAVDELCSPLFQQMFEEVIKEQPDPLSDEQYTILKRYPIQISWYEGDQRDEVIERVRRAHLPWFNTWLNKAITNQPPYFLWNTLVDDLMLHETNLLFRMDCGDVITSDGTRTNIKEIANTIRRILLSITESNSEKLDKAAIPIVQILLSILFYFTWDDQLGTYLKSLQLVELMNVFLKISNNDSEIHLQAYRILATVMTEIDIKQTENGTRMAAIFIAFLKNNVDAGPSFEAQFHNCLRCLKVLTQHDEICEELIKQEGLFLFLRCFMENHFNPLKAKLPALEILLAVAFNKDFASTLKNNTNFMNHLRTLTSSPEEKLQRVATAFIWKLEKELEPETMTTMTADTSKKQYDIMISYSHSDKDLCDRLLNTLEKDQYHVWIDSQLMHGATFDATVEAIENAEFVLICMSDAYKQNPLCKLEASYAAKCRCNIIPLVMTPDYRVDGWLDVLTSSFNCVDFPKLGFDEAYTELKRQMELFRVNTATAAITIQEQVDVDPILTVEEQPRPVSVAEKPTESDIAIETYPHCIDNWTEEHVKYFLLDKKLDVLLPIVDGMNGQALHQAYLMCQANQQGMYLSLKEDVARSGHDILNLKDYLTFLRELKFYIPSRVGNQLNSTSVVCNLM